MNPQKILLVEDDQFTRELYDEVLKDAGFDVTTAVDGEEGLNHIRAGGYDLISIKTIDRSRRCQL